MLKRVFKEQVKTSAWPVNPTPIEVGIISLIEEICYAQTYIHCIVKQLKGIAAFYI